MINRRGFFSGLAGLPFIGGLLARKSNDVEIRMSKDDFERLLDYREKQGWTNGAYAAFHMAERNFRSDARYIEQLKKEIADLNATLEVIEKNHIEWIGVKDKLPELDVVPYTKGAEFTQYRWSRPVLAYMEYGQVFAGFARLTGHIDDPCDVPVWASLDTSLRAWQIFPITHWAELPSGPSHA